jgi:hypothetical protein
MKTPSTRTLRPTEVARAAMRQIGLRTMYTNKYKTCHTVKAYAFESPSANDSIIKFLQEKIDTTPALKGCSVSMSPGQGYYSAPGIIIRVPFAN